MGGFSIYDSNGYDPVTGQNSGNLGFQSLQGTVGGQNYYAPVPFNPDGINGVNAPGYIDFGANYNQNPGASGNTDYFYYGNYGEALAASNPGGKPISYGSAPVNSLVGTPGNGDPMINGVDYTQGASYANQAANGIGGTYTPGQTSLTPYTQYAEPGYKAPQYSAASPTGLQSYGPDGSPIQATGNDVTFLYGNNGSAGQVSGTLTNTTPGQSTQFYQNQNPSLQALTQSRS